MKEYHKIETPFNRAEDGTKKLIEGSWRNETVEMLKNIRWRWTEKVDGTNIRINWDGHKVTFGGRTDRAQIPADLVNWLNGKFGTSEAEELFEQKFGENEVTLYGEGYGRKIQGVGSLYIPDGVSVILFDVTVGETFLKWDGVCDVATAFGISVVPVAGTGTLEEAVAYIKTKPQSIINEAAPMEGVVCRPVIDVFDRMHRRVIVKVKVHDFA